MHGKWRCNAFPEDVWVAESFGLSLPDGAEVIAPEGAVWQVGAWFRDDGAGCAALSEMAAAVGDAGPSGPRLSAAETSPRRRCRTARRSRARGSR
jgi:hypothetical protein